MVDVIQRLILESEVGDAKTKLEQVRKEQTKLEQAIRDSAKTTDKASTEYKEMVSSLKALVDRERALEKQIQDTNDAYGDRSKVVKKTETFDRVSQDVSLAGDVESNLRTVGGAVGAFGGAGLERGIGQGAELFAVVEALPRLKAAAAGLPQVFGAAATAMDTSKGALGGLILGLAGLGIALQLAAAQAEKQRKSALEQLDAQRQANEFVATASREEIEAELAAAKQRRDILVANEQLAREQQAEARRQLTEATSAETTQVAELAARLKLGAGEFEALRQNVENTTNATAAAHIEIATYEQALTSGALATKDAANAERELAAERTQGILTDAAQAGELEGSRLRLADATREQIAAELEGLEIRKASLEAELAILQASGDTSEAVQSKIAQLTETLSFLGEQSEQLEGLRSKAKTNEQVEAEKKLAAARDETAKASGKAAAAEGGAGSGFARRRADSARNRSAGTLSFGFLAGQTGAGEQKADTNEIDKQIRDVQNSIIEANNDFEEQRVQQVIDNNRRLQDIARNFGDQRVDALEDLNFLGLERLNTEEARANRDQSIDNKRANDDRLRDQQSALRELQNQEQQFHQQRLQLNQQGFQAALTQQQQFMNAFVGNFSNMFGALSGARSGVRRPATP